MWGLHKIQHNYPGITHLRHNPLSLEQLQMQVRLYQTSSSNLQPVLQVFHAQRNDLRYRAEIEKLYYAP